MPNRRHLEVLAVVALPVVALDLATKQLAVTMLAGREIPLASFARLFLVHNRASALGVWLGAHTWAINVGVTLSAIVIATLVCRGLATVDRKAPYALGLIVGAALGNLTSLLIPPAGVPDFIAVGSATGRQLVFNFADVAAYAGVMMCLRTAVVLARAARLERERRPAVARALIAADREIAIPLAAEPGYADRAYADRPYADRLYADRGRAERAYADGAAFPITADGVVVRRAAIESPPPAPDARP